MYVSHAMWQRKGHGDQGSEAKEADDRSERSHTADSRGGYSFADKRFSPSKYDDAETIGDEDLRVRSY